MLACHGAAARRAKPGALHPRQLASTPCAAWAALAVTSRLLPPLPTPLQAAVFGGAFGGSPDRSLAATLSGCSHGRSRLTPQRRCVPAALPSSRCPGPSMLPLRPTPRAAARCRGTGRTASSTTVSDATAINMASAVCAGAVARNRLHGVPLMPHALPLSPPLNAWLGHWLPSSDAPPRRQP